MFHPPAIVSGVTMFFGVQYKVGLPDVSRWLVVTFIASRCLLELVLTVYNAAPQGQTYSLKT